MGGMLDWLVVAGVTAAINLVPAFMPPTWIVLAFFHLQYDLSIWRLAVVGALSATAGRAMLAAGSRVFGERVVPRRWRENVRALAGVIRGRKRYSLPVLALFTLSPVPSNHLFIAAGIARVPLRVILAVFGAGRFVSYALWVGAADTAARSLREAVGPGLGGGVALVTQIVGLAVLLAVMHFDWPKLIERRGSARPRLPAV